jgi:glutamate:GABA antiporter
MTKAIDSPIATSSDELTLAQLVPPRLLPKVLGTPDLVMIYVAVIYGSYAAGQMASIGWQSISIWFLAYALFLVPCGMCVLELGNLFPDEGGVYVWSNKTMGKFWGFMGGWISWMPVFGAIATWSAVVAAFIGAVTGELQVWQQVGIQLLVVWGGALISLLRLRQAQNIVNKMFYVHVIVTVLVFGVGLYYAFTHGGPVTPLPSSWQEMVPNLNQNGAIFALAVLLLLGVETPFNMGVEIRQVNRSAITMVFGGSLILGVFYLFLTAGVLLTTAAADTDPYTALALVFDNAGLKSLFVLAAVAYAFCHFMQSALYQYAYARLLFISGVEKFLPRVFAYVDPRTRAPVAAILLQAALITVLVIVMFSNTSLEIATQVMLASLTVVWCLSNFFFIFPLVLARRQYPHLYDEPGRVLWKVPGGMAGVWTVVVVATLGNVIAIYYCFAAPWVADLTVAQWAPRVGVVSGGSVIIGIILYFVTQMRAQEIDIEEELAQYAVLEDPDL